MFETDTLSELNFVLEFNLPKEISDDQDHIKLSVHHVAVPTVEIPAHLGYTIKMYGQIYLIEFYEHIKDKLCLLEKWSHILHDEKFGWANSNLYIDAKLYGYNKDGELVTSWVLYKLYPILFPIIKFSNQVELQFGFVDATSIKHDNNSLSKDKPMYDISKYIKEYKDRENKCKFCAYYNIQGGRCYTCKNHNWFVQEIPLKQYVMKRVSEDSNKEFINSKEAVDLKAKIDLRKNVYDDFNKYVKKQKEILDQELEEKRKEWSDFQSEYAYKTAKYISDNIDKALISLDSME